MSEAGWYRNDQGRMQYWDGRQWVAPQKKRRAWPWVLGAALAIWVAVAAVAVVVVVQDRPWERMPQPSAAGEPLSPSGEFRYSLEYSPASAAEEEALEMVERFLRAYSVADCTAVESMMFEAEFYGLDCPALQEGLEELWFGTSLWELKVVEGWFEGDTSFTIGIEESYRYFGTLEGPYSSAVSFIRDDEGHWKFLEFE